MPQRSAGLLMFRRTATGGLQVLLGHPGGPYWARKSTRGWSIPKGELLPGEDALDAARREFVEETGFAVGDPLVALGDVRQASGKLVTAWAFEGDCDPAALRSNTFEMEWPPRSGNRKTFPELDRVEWFDVVTAREKIIAAQAGFLARLEALLAGA